MGLPFLSGYYSKEKILEYSLYIYNESNLFAFWLGSFSAFLTSLYSFRLMSLSICSQPKSLRLIYEQLHTNIKFYLILVLFCLGFGTIFSGFFFNDLIIGNGTDWLQFTSNQFNFFEINLHLGNIHLNLLAFYYTLFGMFIFYCIYMEFAEEMFPFFIESFILESINSFYKYERGLFFYIYIFLARRWNINLIYNRYIGNLLLYLGYNQFYLVLDKGFFEGIILLNITLINNISIFCMKNFYKNFFFTETLFILFLLYLNFFNLLNFLIYFSFLENLIFSNFFFAVPRKKIRKKLGLKESNLKKLQRTRKIYYIKTFLEKKK